MRKSLALILSIAMVFSMFSSLAFAADAELTAEQKYEALKAKGIFAGMGDGSAGLDQAMTRAQFARVAALILGLEGIGATDTKEVATKPFSDVELGQWYTEEVAAAKEAGIFVGNGDGTFNPNGDISVQELSVVVAGLLTLTPVADATVEGADAWAAGYIKAIQNAGVDFPTNYTEAAVRADLASLAFQADAAINGTVPQGVVSATITGAKKITVQFGAVVDTAKAAVSIKKGAATTNIASTTFSEDKKSAVVETSTKLTTGDYTISVTGVTEAAQTVTVTAANEKVTKVEFTSLNAILDRMAAPVTKVTAKYVVENQYGENIANDTTLTFSSGKGEAVGEKGTLTLTVTAPAAFTKGELINVSALHTATSTFTSGVLVVVDPAKASDIAFTGIYNADGKTPEVGQDSGSYFILLSVKDQYGNAMTNTTQINDDVVVTNAHTNIFDAFVQTTTPFVKSSASNDKLALKLPDGTFDAAGTAKITMVSKSTGKLATYDLVVAQKSIVDVLTLSQPEVAVEGEDNIEIPFTAVDQFGKEVTSITTLGEVTLSTSPASPVGTVKFVRDYVKGVNKLVLDATDLDGTVVITAVTNGKVTMLTIVLKAEAKADVIAGVKDFAKAYAKGAADKLEMKDVIINDQYGRALTNDQKTAILGTTVGKYQIAVSTGSDTKVGLTGTTTVVAATYGISSSADGVDFTGLAKGTSTITLKLVEITNVGVGTEAVKDVAGTNYTFTARTVDKSEIVSYEVADIAPVYTGGVAPAYDKAVTVNGVLENGDKVKLPNNGEYYTVSTSDAANITFVDGKINATAAALPAGTDKTIDASVLVVITGTTTETIVKTVKVTNVAPVNTTLVLQTAGTATKESDTVISVELADLADESELEAAVVSAVKVTDTYGVVVEELASAYSNISVSNITGNRTIDGINDKTETTIKEGDTFDVTAVTTNGKFISFKVIVK